MNEERFNELTRKRKKLEQEGIQILSKIKKIDREIRESGWTYRLQELINKGEK